MKRLLFVVAALVGLAVLFVAGIFVVSELGGEVVVVTTQDASGPHETRLWVVDHEGAWWLRSGVAEAGWLRRMQADPQTQVARGDERRRVQAVPVADPGVRDRIHDLMREKYGLADRLISAIRDGTSSVPVRLDPVEDD